MTETVQRTRRPRTKTSRRRFAQERERLISFCKIYIDILAKPMEGLTPLAQARVDGKRETLEMILKQMGESINGNRSEEESAE